MDRPNRKKFYKKKEKFIFVSNLKIGEKVTKKDIASFRPSLGIEVKYYSKIIGKN